MDPQTPSTNPSPAPAQNKKSQKGLLAALVVVIVVIVVLAIAYTQRSSDQVTTPQEETTMEQTGETFVSEEDHFQIAFLTPPQRQTQQVPISGLEAPLDLTLYVSNLDEEAAHMVSVSTYPPQVDVSNPETNLEGALNGMLQSSEGNEAVTAQIVDFGSYKALEYAIENAAQNIRVEGKIIAVGSTFYNVLTQYTMARYDAREAASFISSFQLQE